MKEDSIVRGAFFGYEVSPRHHLHWEKSGKFL